MRLALTFITLLAIGQAFPLDETSKVVKASVESSSISYEKAGSVRAREDESNVARSPRGDQEIAHAKRGSQKANNDQNSALLRLLLALLKLVTPQPVTTPQGTTTTAVHTSTSQPANWYNWDPWNNWRPATLASRHIRD